jgi:peptidyl-prolyl cis-trans isomerase D
MVMQKLNTGTTGKTFKFLLLGVLFAAVAGLALTDMGGFFRTGGSGTSVATVGGKDINIMDFARSYQTTLQGANLQDAAARQMGVPFMVLNQEITREVLRQASEKSGVHVGRQYVAAFLAKELEQFPGNGTQQEKLNMILQKQGVNERTLVRLLAEDSGIDTIVNAIVDTQANLPDDLAAAPWRAVRERRSADLIRITPAALKNVEKPDIESFYKEHKENYRTVEKRGGEALIISQSNLIRNTAVSDTEIEAYYNEHKDQFMSAPRVRFEQLIVQSEAKADEIAEAKPSSLEKYKTDGDYVPADWYTKTNLPKELSDELYPDAKTGLIEPIKTSLGWHVVIVKEYQDGKARPFSEVKSTLARQLKDEKLDRQLADAGDRIDGMIAEGSGLPEIAREFNAKQSDIAKTERADAAATFKSLGIPETASARVAEAFFSLDEEEISPVQELPNGDILILHLTELEPSVVPAFEKIKDRLSADAKRDAQTRAMGKLAEELIGKFDDKADGFSKAVSQAGLSRSPVSGTLEELQKSVGQPEGQILFSLDDNNKISYVSGADSVTLVVLKSIQPEKGKPDEKTLSELRAGIRQSFAHELQAQFVHAWKEDLGVKINDTLMQKQFAPQEKEQQ